MDMDQIKINYNKQEIYDYILKTHDHILQIHGINITRIPGYERLGTNDKKTFNEFIINFYNAQGLERRDKLYPISINFVEEQTFLGKNGESDDYYIPLGGKVIAIYSDSTCQKISSWNDKKYKHIKCIETEKSQYLKFEYQDGKRKEWQHVVSATKWY